MDDSLPAGNSEEWVTEDVKQNIMLVAGWRAKYESIFKIRD